jgi:hypothetical protein
MKGSEDIEEGKAFTRPPRGFVHHLQSYLHGDHAKRPSFNRITVMACHLRPRSTIRYLLHKSTTCLMAKTTVTATKIQVIFKLQVRLASVSLDLVEYARNASAP